MNPRLACCALLLISAACAESDSISPPPPVSGTSPQPSRESPVGWTIRTLRWDLYDGGVDRGIRRSGNTSSFLTGGSNASSQPSSSIGVMQDISAVPYRGKRVRLSGYARTADVQTPGAGLLMSIDGPTERLLHDNMFRYGRAIVGSSDWTQHSVVLDVPSNAISINLGAQLQGSGTMWIDDLQFDVVDASVPTTGVYSPLSINADSLYRTGQALRFPQTPYNLDFESGSPIAPAAAAWIASVATPFSTAAPGSGFTDLAPLGELIGNARVVGFGEATHGTREFFLIKHRAFEYLVERHNFTHFGIEANMPESRAVDRYVTSGEGDPAQLLAGLYFWTWNTQEVLDLILWMRAFNVSVGEPRLRFFGFDMQAVHQSIDSVPVMLDRVDSRLAARSRATLACLLPGKRADGFYHTDRYRAGATDEMRATCRDSLSALARSVSAARASWNGVMSSDDIDWLEQYLSLIRQWEYTVTLYTEPGAIRRDESMAANVIWMQQRNPSARLFLWAHNGHVTRRAGAMGDWLTRQIGDAYRNVGFAFGTGSFNAFVSDASGAPLGLTSARIDRVDPASLDGVFEATGAPRLLLDTRKIPGGGAAASTLTGQLLQTRWIGSGFRAEEVSGYYFGVLLPDDLDGLLWFAQTSPSRLLR